MVAITTLMNERAGLGGGAAVAVSRDLGALIELIKERGLAGRPGDPRSKVADLLIGTEALRLGGMRALTAQMKTGIPGPEGSIGKWEWAKLNQSLTELATDVLGPEGLAKGTALDLQDASQPRQLDRGRDHRGDEEHHRRAGARPSEAQVGGAMRFDFDDEQREIKDTARQFLSRPVQAREGPASSPRPADTTTPCGRRSPSSAGPGSRSPRSTAARASGWSS